MNIWDENLVIIDLRWFYDKKATFERMIDTIFPVTACPLRGPMPSPLAPCSPKAEVVEPAAADVMAEVEQQPTWLRAGETFVR